MLPAFLYSLDCDNRQHMIKYERKKERRIKKIDGRVKSYNDIFENYDAKKYSKSSFYAD